MGKLRQWGATLLILGIGSLVLPYVGMQFQVFRWIAPFQPGAGIAATTLGGVLFLLSLIKRNAPAPVRAVPAVVAAARPVVEEKRPMANQGESSAAFCGECGTALEPGAAFCPSCGTALAAPVGAPVAAAAPPRAATPAAAVAAPAPVPPPAAPPAPAPAKSHTFAYVMLSLLVIVAGVGAYFAFTFGMFTPAKPKQPPALPASVAGTLTEFPLDTATTNPVKPVTLSTEVVDGSSLSPMTSKGLPSGLNTKSIKTVTSATYKAKPADPPVYVDVVDSRDDSASMSREISSAVAAGSSGAATSGVRVQSQAGTEYSGYKVKDSQSETYVLGKANSGVVIVIYAPDPSVMAIADRLAPTVGNGTGLNAMPDLTDAVSNLPAQLPSGMTLSDMYTFGPDDLRAELQQAKKLAQGTGQQGDPQQLIAVIEQFLPQQIVASHYHDASGKEYVMAIGDYGSTISAGKTWLALKAAAQVMKLQSVSVHGTGGLAMTQGEAQIIAFQSGSHLAVVSGSSATGNNALMQLAEAIQF